MGLFKILRGKESTFEFIAQNFARCFLRLEQVHKHRFARRRDMLIAAAVCDALWHLFSARLIELSEFIEWFENRSDDSSLEEVAMDLNRILVLLDNLDVDPLYHYDMVAIVNKNRQAIEHAAKRAAEKGKVNLRIRLQVDAFMNRKRFREARHIIGVLEG